MRPVHRIARFFGSVLVAIVAVSALLCAIGVLYLFVGGIILAFELAGQYPWFSAGLLLICLGLWGASYCDRYGWREPRPMATPAIDEPDPYYYDDDEDDQQQEIKR